MRRDSRAFVIDRPAESHSATYDVLLLAGVPRRYDLDLPSGLEEGSVIEVDGEQWTVADIREDIAGAPARLICIYAA